MLVIDSSLIVSSFLSEEREHKKAKEFLENLIRKGETVLLPEILLPEVASAIARGTKRSDLALSFCRELRKFPNFIFVPVDESIAEFSIEVASKYFLRGADSIYVAIALKYGISLATLDKDKKKKGSKIVNIVTLSKDRLES